MKSLWLIAASLYGVRIAAFDDASILDELDQMRSNLNLRRTVEPRIEIGIDALPHRRRGGGAVRKRVEYLLFAFQTVRNILRNQGGSIIACRSVCWENPLWIMREQESQ